VRYAERCNPYTKRQFDPPEPKSISLDGNSLQPFASGNMVSRKEVVEFHVFVSGFVHFEISKAVKEGANRDVQLGVGEPAGRKLVSGTISSAHEDAAGDNDVRHSNAGATTSTKGHHVGLEPVEGGRVEPARGLEAHGVREGFAVAVHDPGTHADDGARWHEVALECVSGLGNFTWKPAWHAERKAVLVSAFRSRGREFARTGDPP
jgi:hypothetical protein